MSEVNKLAQVANGLVENVTTSTSDLDVLSLWVGGTSGGGATQLTKTILNSLISSAGSAVTSLTGDVTGSGPGATAVTISNGVVTLAKMASLPPDTIIGNNTGVTGTPLALSEAQVTAMLNVFTSGLQGLVPASGGGTVNFLRADGTFAAPTGAASANQSLSNLTNPTAINQDLLPSATLTRSIGSTLDLWSTLYVATIDSIASTLNITSGAIGSGSSATSGVNVSTGSNAGTGATGGLVLETGSTSNGASVATTGELDLLTGNVTTGAGSSGNIILETGVAQNGTSGSIELISGNTGLGGAGTSGNILLQIGSGPTAKGKVQFQDGSQGTAGYIWTSTDTLGSGTWMPNSGGSAISALTGDGTATGPGSVPFTLATVNGNVGSFGSSTSIPNFTVNAKGLITAAGSNVVIAPAGTLTGTTLASNVVASSLTSLGAQSQALDMNSNQINNLAPAILGTDAVNLAQLQQFLQGIDWKQHVRAISTSALPANAYNNGSSGVGATLTSTDGAFPAFAAVDGVTLAVNDRIVVAGEASPANNGIYFLSQQGDGVSLPWILMRSLDADTPTELIAAAVFVDEGTINEFTAWVQQAPAPIVIGTTALTFAKFSSVTPYTFRNGLALTGPDVDVVPGDASLLSTPGSLIVQKDPAGAIIVTGAGLAVQPDGTTLDISANHIEVKAAGISATQLATGAADQLTILGGAGTPLSVAQAPSVVLQMVAGQSFTAATSYLVRMGINNNSETTNQVYAADSSAAVSNGNFWAIGIAQSVAGAIAGGAIPVAFQGMYTLGSGDTNFVSSDIGLPVWLTTAGGFSTTAPSASGTAAYKIGIVADVNLILIDSKQLTGVN